MDPTELRPLLMLLAKDAGDDAAVDRIAEMSDDELAQLVADAADAADAPAE